MTKTLGEQMEEWKRQGKKGSEITYGMVAGNFQSIAGIPDEFCSAEDLEDRERLWYQRQRRSEYRSFDPNSYRD